MTDPNADLLRRYFNGRRFQVSATLERRIVDQLEDGRQARSRTSPHRIAVRAVVAVAAIAIAAVGTTLPAAASTTPDMPTVDRM